MGAAALSEPAGMQLALSKQPARRCLGCIAVVLAWKEGARPPLERRRRRRVEPPASASLVLARPAELSCPTCRPHPTTRRRSDTWQCAADGGAAHAAARPPELPGQGKPALPLDRPPARRACTLPSLLFLCPAAWPCPVHLCTGAQPLPVACGPACSPPGTSCERASVFLCLRNTQPTPSHQTPAHPCVGGRLWAGQRGGRGPLGEWHPGHHEVGAGC